MARSTASLLILLSAITIIWCLAPPPPSRTRVEARVTTERPELAVLRRFAGVDLLQVDPEVLHQLRVALRTLDPRYFELVNDPTPWFVWPYPHDGRPAGWVVVEAQLETESPDPVRFWLTDLDAQGEVRARGGFDTGPRRGLGDIRLGELPGTFGPVVEVAVVRLVFVTDPNPVRRWYARVGDRFELVREEREHEAADQILPKPAP